MVVGGGGDRVKNKVLPRNKAADDGHGRKQTFFQSLFLTAFDARDIKLSDIRDNDKVSAKICLSTYCFFECANDKCETKRWTSARSWITVDLSKPGVLRRYRQKCAKCGQVSWPRVPWKELDDFVDRIIDRYVDRVNGRAKDPPGGGGGVKRQPAHRSDLCEKCGYGKRNCGNSKAAAAVGMKPPV